jgi:hypothetical protein
MHWFKRVGWFHWPVSIMGGLACLGVAAFCVNVFIAIDQHSHSNTDTLYGVFPFFACSFLLLDWLARNTDGSKRGGQ